MRVHMWGLRRVGRGVTFVGGIASLEARARSRKEVKHAPALEMTGAKSVKQPTHPAGYFITNQSPLARRSRIAEVPARTFRRFSEAIRARFERRSGGRGTQASICRTRWELRLVGSLLIFTTPPSANQEPRMSLTPAQSEQKRD